MPSHWKERPPDGRNSTMESLYILIPMSVVLVFLALWIFFRASDSGQFDDLVGPGMRVLQDDDRAPAAKRPSQSAPDDSPDDPSRN